ncbi:MAG: hypothetical protein R2733_03675 [Acidimicrobiales bacterium]
MPLFIGSTQQMLSSMHRKIEHQGSGGIYASAVEVNRAFTKVSEGEPLTISRSLWCEAKSYLSRRQDRQALVAAVSAAEVAVEQAIQRHFESILQPETVASVLKRAGGIVEKLRILEAERVLPPGLPSIGKGIDIAGARNQAIHSGSWPERSTAAEAVEWSRKVVIELDADG